MEFWLQVVDEEDAERKKKHPTRFWRLMIEQLMPKDKHGRKKMFDRNMRGDEPPGTEHRMAS